MFDDRRLGTLDKLFALFGVPDKGLELDVHLRWQIDIPVDLVQVAAKGKQRIRVLPTLDAFTMIWMIARRASRVNTSLVVK